MLLVRRGLIRSVHTAAHSGRVLGCGSNVVDRFFKVRALPQAGQKGFFALPTKILEDSVVGGVTLNHLAWAAALGTPTGLMALQGDDDSGQIIRAKMKRMGVSDANVVVSKDYTTAESYVFLQPDGERSIIMASGASSMINHHVMSEHFVQAASKAGIITTEISQIPLSGVLTLLETAKNNNILSFLDVDVAPSVAIDEAQLGTMEQLKQCVMSADVLKPARHAAEELVNWMDSSISVDDAAKMSSLQLSQELLRLSGARMVALTSGGEGCVFVTKDEHIVVPSFKIDKVVDATGAGDAFLGGLVAGVYKWGFPANKSDLERVARVANATGAACCEVLGALPVETVSTKRVLELEPEAPVPDLAVSKEATSTSFTPDFQKTAVEVVAEDRAALAALSVSAEQLNNVTHRLLMAESVFVTGVGKSGFVGQRLAASLASVGVRSQFVHATEWAHGDLGRALEGDVVIALSHSGKTAETLAAVRLLHKRKVSVISIVGSADSILAKKSHECLSYALPQPEGYGGVPSSSIVVQESIANAIVRGVITLTSFSGEQFIRNHPGGHIGKRASTAKRVTKSETKLL